MGRYVNWNDVKGHIDEQVAEPDMAITTKGIGFAEDKFDNKLREQYAVPFDEALHPEAFALAQQITSRWAAAWYLINARQSEVSDERAMWYADRLLASADDLFEVFFEGTPPADTPESAADFSELPQDGYDNLSATQQADLEPVFKRAHMPGKSDPW